MYKLIVLNIKKWENKRENIKRDKTKKLNIVMILGFISTIFYINLDESYAISKRS